MDVPEYYLSVELIKSEGSAEKDTLKMIGSVYSKNRVDLNILKLYNKNFYKFFLDKRNIGCPQRINNGNFAGLVCLPCSLNLFKRIQRYYYKSYTQKKFF